MEDITIHAKSISDISAIGNDTIEVSLEDASLDSLIDDIGASILLDAMSIDDIKEYLADKEEPEEK